MGFRPCLRADSPDLQALLNFQKFRNIAFFKDSSVDKAANCELGCQKDSFAFISYYPMDTEDFLTDAKAAGA
jgi:hypothetical protein